MTRNTIVFALAALLALPAAAHAQSAVDAAKQKVTPADPCCNIVAINARTGMVTYAFKATGARFSFRVPVSSVRNFAVGQVVNVGTSDGLQCQSNAASSGNTTRCGTNVPRDADTRPKDCIATNSAGQSWPVPCPRQ